MEIKEVPELRQPETTFPFYNSVTITSRLYNVPEIRRFTVRGAVKFKHLRYRWGKPLFSYGPKVFLLAPVGSECGRALALARRGDMVKATGYLCPNPMIWRKQKIFTWVLRLAKIEVMGMVPLISMSKKQQKATRTLEKRRQAEWVRVREMERMRKTIPEARDIADDILDDLDFEV